jgi:RNA polymerase sigma-70 factor (ECF subfamily)
MQRTDPKLVPMRYSSASPDELVFACAKLNDDAAWREFVARFQRPISLSVLRTAHRWGEIPRQLLDDLVQETYLKLCADACSMLLDFSRDHPEAILAYVKTIAVNVTHDHFKSIHSQKRGAGRVQDSLENLDARAESASLGSQRATERHILMQEIDHCLTTCSAGPDQQRDRLIFWLYYQQGMSAKAIAALPTVGLTAKGVESAVLRLTRQVRQQVANVRTGPSGQPSKKGFRPAESY